MDDVNGESEVQINLRLKGADAQRFNRFKGDEKQRTHAAAAYKAIFERLEEWERENGKEAVGSVAQVGGQ